MLQRLLLPIVFPTQIATVPLAIVPFATVAAIPAIAGERLHFRTGSVDPIEVAETLKKLEASRQQKSPRGRSRSSIESGKSWSFESLQFDPVSPEDDEDLSWVGTKGKNPKNKADSKAQFYFVVQLKSQVTNQDLLNFATLKIKPLRYLPDDAFVVRASARQMQVLSRSSPQIRAIVRYQADWKLAPELGTSSVFSGDPEIRMLVRFFPGENSDTASRTLSSVTQVIAPKEPDSASGARKMRKRVAVKQKVDLKVLSVGPRVAVIEARRSAARVIADAVDSIEWIEPEPAVASLWFQEAGAASASTGDYTDLDGFESGTRIMGFETAWAQGLFGKGETVAFADSGFQKSDARRIHPDFQRSPSGASNAGDGTKTRGWSDPDGHGTHMAGIIAGSGSSSLGKIRGGAFEASLLPQSFNAPRLRSLSLPSRIQDMFAKAYSLGARVHTNSWGSVAAAGLYDSTASQIDEFISNNPDFLVLFAAGNGGEDLDHDGRIDSGSISAPGTAKNVLTVGASKNLVRKGGVQSRMVDLTNGPTRFAAEPIASSKFSDTENGLAAFSSRGPTSDGRLKPEVVAPGTNVLATRSIDAKSGALWGAYNDLYLWSGGTSMATPLAASAATLVRSYLQLNRHISNPSASLVKCVLMHTAFDMFPGQFGSGGAARGQELLSKRPNFDEGYGRLDLTQATQLSQALIVDERVGLSPGEKHVYPIKLARRAVILATLVYTDVAGSSAASKTLVNDLDMALIDAQGKRIEVLDRLNNHEHIEITVPAGSYRVEVSGFNVPISKQAYSLVVSVR